MTTSRDGEGLFPAGTLKSCLVLAVLFVLSRLAYYDAGVRFLDNLAELYQVADLSLLKSDTFRTVLSAALPASTVQPVCWPDS